MRFLIHVIDNISSHKIINGEYKIQKSETNENADCHIFRCDAFYSIEEQSEESAVIKVSKIIKTKDNEGNFIPFSKMFILSNEKGQTTDFNTVSLKEINDEFLVTQFQTIHKKFVLTGYIEREKGTETWVEYHKVEFFVCPENKIVEILAEK